MTDTTNLIDYLMIGWLAFETGGESTVVWLGERWTGRRLL